MRESNRQGQRRWELAEHRTDGILANGTPSAGSDAGETQFALSNYLPLSVRQASPANMHFSLIDALQFAKF